MRRLTRKVASDAQSTMNQPGAEKARSGAAENPKVILQKKPEASEKLDDIRSSCSGALQNQPEAQRRIALWNMSEAQQVTKRLTCMKTRVRD